MYDITIKIFPVSAPSSSPLAPPMTPNAYTSAMAVSRVDSSSYFGRRSRAGSSVSLGRAKTLPQRTSLNVTLVMRHR